MEEDLKWRETLEARLAAAAKAKQPNPDGKEVPGDDTPESQYEEKDDEDIYFAPEKHNVIFASAIDGWAFTIRQFASLYEKKLGITKSVLEKVLWGDFYLDPKTKRVLAAKHLKGRSLKPMFVQLVLENIWAVYESTVLNKSVFLSRCTVLSICKSITIFIFFGNTPTHKFSLIVETKRKSNVSSNLSPSRSSPANSNRKTHARSSPPSSRSGCPSPPPSSSPSSNNSPLRPSRRTSASLSFSRPHLARKKSTKPSKRLWSISTPPTRRPLWHMCRRWSRYRRRS